MLFTFSYGYSTIYLYFYFCIAFLKRSDSVYFVNFLLSIYISCQRLWCVLNLAILSAPYLFFALYSLYFRRAFAVTLTSIKTRADCWRLPPFIIVLFCLFMLLTEIFSIRLSVAKEKRILLSSLCLMVILYALLF